jgi:hypothetical protein
MGTFAILSVSTLKRYGKMLTLLLCLGFAHLVAAKKNSPPVNMVKAPKNLYSAFAWQIAEAPELLSDSIWVSEFSSFLTITLVPATVSQTSAPVMSTLGQQIIPAKTQLIPFVGDTPGMCTTNPPGAVKQTFFINKIESSNYCFLDTDKDGLFDQYFGRAGDVIGTVWIPKERYKLVPFKGDPVDPKSFQLKKNLHLQYNYFASLADSLSFNLCFSKDVPRSANSRGQGYYMGCLAPDTSVSRSKLPRSFSVLGGTFLVEDKGDKRVRVRQTSAIMPQPFILKGF